MVMTYDEYLKKTKKKKKEEPKVVLGYSSKNNVNNSTKSTTNTQTLIDKYIAEQKAKGYTLPAKKPQGDSIFSAFEDGYQLGDISNAILKGGTKLGKAVYNTGKEVVAHPVQSAKTFGVGIGEGINKANDLVNNAVDDIFDWIVPGREEKDKNKASVSIIEMDRFSKTATKEEKAKVIEEYKKKYGKDSALYKSVEEMLTRENTSEDKNILNAKYYDSETYKKVVEGDLTKGQENIYGLGENVGQMLPSVGASIINPLLGTGLFFTQSQQSYTEEAIERGYTEGKARAYGLIMGGAEVLVERLGFDELGGLKKLSNTSIKKAMVGEGLEEFVMPYIDDVVSHVGFEDGYSWEEFGETTEEALEGAVIGATVGVIMSAGGRGLQKVDNVIQKVNSGQEITQEDLVQAGKEIQKNAPELLDEVMEAVPETVRQELAKEDVRSEDIAVQDDIAPVVEQLEQGNIPIQQAGTQDIAPVGDNVVQQAGVQDQAPNERQQNYVSEAKETDSIYRKNLNEDASKYANNSKRTHEFVNTLSNISEATGENIRLTNNTSEEMIARRNQLIERYAKNKGISVEEATTKLKNIIIDGYKTDDGIVINVDSPKALNRLVGHELTHALEKTGHYKKLQKIALDFAKTRKNYIDTLEILESNYDGVDYNGKMELTADIVGDYLFSDKEFIRRIQREDRNLFQRIYDEIKHLIKLVTANTKEARQLEQLKYEFEKAMQEHKSDKTNKVTVQETKSNLATEVESNTQEKEETVQKVEEEYSLSQDNKDRKLSEEQIDFFKDSKIRDENGNLLTVYHGTKADFNTFNNDMSGDNYEGWSYSGKGIYFTDSEAEAKEFGDYSLGEGDTKIKEVYLNITNPFDTSTTDASVLEKLSEGYDVDKGSLERGDFLLRWFRSNGINASEVLQKNGYDGVIDYGHYVVYNSNQIKEVTNKKPTLSEDIRYSLSSTDSEGRELSKEQVEFFEDSKVRDAEGRLKVVYHGTEAMAGLPEDAWFTVFDTERAGRNGSLFGAGFYFTDSKEKAQGYAHSKGKVYETYLNIKNPFKPLELDLGENIDTFYDIIEQEFKNQLPSDWGSLNEYQKGRTTRYILEDNGYDGVFVGNTYVAFNSNQIKNVDNTNPTDSDDIRYSLTKASDEQVKQASGLEEQNKTPEEIYLETGAYRGADGKWRTEIDDSGAYIKTSSTMVGGKYKLHEILSFPKLYKAYPEFKNMTVVFDNDMLPSQLGNYNPDTNILTINSSIYDYDQAELLSAKKQLADWDNTVKTYEVLFSGEQIEQQLETLKKKAKQYKRKDYQKELKSTLLHELQHVIQETEGFTSGANPSYWARKQQIAETYKNAYRERENELFHKMDMDIFYNDIHEKITELSYEEFLQAKEDFINNTEYAQEYRDLQELIKKNKKRYEILTGRSAYELYRDTAGEQEARNVQDRMGMSKKQRKETMPFAGNRETVFYEGSYNEEKYGVFLNQTEDVSYSLSNTGEMVDNQGNKVTLETSETGTHGTLMAIHNLNESKFKGVMELGGFPVPSIAITKPEIVNHSQFGSISVLFDKSTINPANPKNEVYDRDVWSPTFPRVEYDINGEDIRKYITKNLDWDNSNGIINHAQLNYMYSGNLSDKLDRVGKEQLIENIKKDKEMKYLYKKLVEKGEYTEPTKPEKYSVNYTNETLRRVINSYNGDMELPDFYYHYLNYGDMSLTEDETKALKEQVRQAIIPEIQDGAEQWANKYEKTPEQKEKMINIFVKTELDKFDNSYFEYKDIIRDASRLYEFGERNVIDEEATLNEIGDKINQEEFEKWVDDTFGKMLDNATKGIRNDKDIFTPSGNRRSFKSLHEDYNLSNVVKYLTSKKTVGGEEGFGAGSNFGTLQAKMSNRFNSIEDIKSAEDRIQFGEEVKEKLDNYSNTIYQYMSDLREYNYNKDSGYYYGDNTGYALNDFAGYKTQNIANLRKALENNGVNSKEVPIELLEKIVETVNELKYIPTDYFEAKPQRAVGLDEVQAVVIPNDVSPEFKQQLQDAGLTYYEYDRSIEGDRQRVINQFDELKFSLSRTTDDIAPVKDADVFGSDIAVQEAIAPLQEQVQKLTKAITDLQENIAPASRNLAEEEGDRTLQQMTDEDAPVDEGTFTFLDNEIEVKKKQEIVNEIASDFNIKKTEARELYNKIDSIAEPTVEDIVRELETYREVKFQEEDDYVKSIQDYIRGTRLDISEIKKQIPDYGNKYRMSNMGKGLILGNSGQSIDSFYQELNELSPNEFPLSVTAEADQLELISEFMYKDKEITYTDILDDDTLQILAQRIYSDIGNHERYRHTQSGLYFLNKELKDMTPPGEVDNDIPVASNTEQTEEIAPIGKKTFEEVAKKLAEKKLAKQTNTATPKVENNTPRIEKSKYRNFRDTTQRLFVNEMVETDNLAKESGNLNIKFKGDMLNAVAGEIEGEIYTAQTDNEGHAIGKSISGLFQKAKETGLYDAFNDYLEHYSNIDRHAQGKGSKTPLEVSQKLVKEYERTYPEFKQWGKDVWKYGANVRDNLIDAGIINEEFAETLGTMYPHYVPYMENREMSNYNPDLGEIKPKGVIKRAEGGAKNLLPIEDALTKYTFGYKKAVRQNQFYQEIIKTLGPGVDAGADVRNDAIDLDDTLYKDETGNYLTAYVDGKRISTRISDDLYTGLKNDLSKQIKGLEEKFALVTEPVQKLSEIRRNLLTSWNPMFIIKNPIMDVQDALFNSKYTKDFMKNYPGAFVELGKASTETARQFLTLYGSGNVMGEYSSDGTVKKSNFLKGIQKANNVMELAPRYAEFKASLENGATIQEAMYNAREVTTNFSRGGTITKALNKNGFTFLNVSVQGFDKFIRNFSGENGTKGFTGALLKATVLGVVPALFNDLVFGGDDEDEEYEALPDYIKDNYYLIKTGEGEFIRIPKGRMLSVFGSAGRRTLEFMQGEEDAFEGFLKNANSQVGISNPLDSNILTPLIQAYGSENGEAWYGGDLVPSRLQDKAPEEQYDATTDKMSIWLGDKLKNVPIIGDKIASPYKLNYVLDQYLGGIGDIFLPMITEESTSDAEGLGMLLAPIKDQFTANSTFDNKYAGEIYDLSDEMDKMPTAIKETDEYKIQDAYLYSVTSEMGKLYAERRKVQADKNLSKSEKYKKVQAIQDQINSLAKEGMENYKNVSKTDNYAIVGGREFNKYTTDDGTERWGSVFEDTLEDLNSLGMELEEKTAYFNATKTISSIQDSYKGSDDYAGKKRDVIGAIKGTNLTGEQKAYLYDKYYGNSDVVEAMVTLNVDIDSFLDYEAQDFTADKYANGKTVPNSKKSKVFEYINSMPIEFEQKLILTKLQYPSYNEYNPTIINYLNKSDITYEQMEKLLTKMDFKVDENGNIRW